MKKFLAIFIVTAMSITIVGCGGKTDTEDDTKAPVENSSESTSEIGEEGAGETTTSQVADNETTGNGESNEETTTSEQVTTEKPTPEPTPTPTLTPEPHMHSYTESVTKEATCTGKGIKTFSCNCGNSYTEVIKATGHNYEVVADSKVFATCTNSGKESDTKCSFCGDVIEGKVIPKISHSYGEYVYNNDASTEKDGTETATCGNCGNKDTRTVASTRIEICPYKLYTIAYDNQGYPYFYGKWVVLLTWMQTTGRKQRLV